MTETTDIKALHVDSANLMLSLHKIGAGQDCTLMAAQFFTDVFRLIEAERQQREAAEEVIAKALGEKS